MKTIRVLIAVFALIAAGQASALQLGQLTARSRLGEALDARIEIYGVTAAAIADFVFDIKPDIGTSGADAVAAMRATTALAAGGQPYVRLTSERPITEPSLSFRVRLATSAGAIIQRYTLALAPPPALASAPPHQARRAIPVARTAVKSQPAPAHTLAGNYGPVRSGQSLWRILQRTGLAHGDTSATIARIVANNPHAFVGGDANRLIAGVMLDLGVAALEASVAPAPLVPAAQTATTSTDAIVAGATVPPSTNAAPGAAAVEDDTAARLAALERKFQAIRARYAEQRQTNVAAVPPASLAPASADTSSLDLGAARAKPGSTRPVVAPRTASALMPSPARSSTTPMSMITLSLLGVGAGIAVLLLVIAYARHASRRQVRRGQHVVAQNDQNLVAQISLKAEKRLQLEDQFKRSLKAKPQIVSAPPPTTIERAVEAQNVPAIAFEEIETRIAYGQYTLAETLLRDVLARSPSNHRAKLRLAEVHYLNEQPDAFVALAEEIHRKHRADIDDDDWSRIMRMGKVIAPERPPFSGPLPIESARRVG